MPGYITNHELATLLKDDGNLKRNQNSNDSEGASKHKQDVVVIDVRDDDFSGGNIVGCVNSPANTFLDGVNALIDKHKDSSKIVFHCSLSQQRGPKAARIYEETRTIVLSGEAPRQEVLILRDGFAEFQKHYKDDPKLVEKWDKERWEGDFDY